MVVQERQTLRSSLTMLEFSQQRAEAAQHAAMHQQDQQDLQQPVSRDATAAAAAGMADLGWLTGVPETAQGDMAGFSGQVLQEPYRGLSPSRAVLQQLHEAGRLATPYATPSHAVLFATI
jgi:hypothetical protein